MAPADAPPAAGAAAPLPFPPGDVAALERALSEPDATTRDALAGVQGDLVVLGAGGKMGPTLATMARRALDDAGRGDVRVRAVSRWTDADAAHRLRDAGVEPVVADLAEPAAVRALPEAGAVIYMAGQKFGTRDAPERTWLLNAVVPWRCGARYAGVPMVAFSTGNVYPLVAADGGGATEDGTPPGPVGEYAASCVARERLLTLAAAEHGSPLAVVRLNYAVDLRYGVLVDLARRILAGEPVDVTMGHANVIWQGDANRLALAALPHAAVPRAGGGGAESGPAGVPPFVVNVTGVERLAVRGAATRLAARLGRPVAFTGTEAPTALLSDVSRMLAALGAPRVDAATLTDWVAAWVGGGGPVLGKPTRFEVRDGVF